MNYEDLYMKYEKYIHYLLKKYYIRYNYDEYFQMLMIRLWELQHQYDYRRSKNFHAYLRTKLHFYLLDLFRKQQMITILSEASLATQIAPKTSFLSLELYFIFNQLTSKQRQWLVYHLQGYTQEEICEKMCCALSTIKNYQRQTYDILKSNMSPRP